MKTHRPASLLFGAALSLTLCGSLLAACGSSGPSATATLESRSGSTATGTATFTLDGSKVTMTLTASKLTAGAHAVHLHDVGDCSAADATSAGGHWNPTQMMHGNATGGAHHAGDIGNLTAGADGSATLTFTTTEWTIGTGTNTDVVGHAVIIHEKVDDFTTQPTGNAGARQACGVITLK
jgi:Cu-Zn family superoxide dismutase